MEATCVFHLIILAILVMVSVALDFKLIPFTALS